MQGSSLSLSFFATSFSLNAGIKFIAIILCNKFLIECCKVITNKITKFNKIKQASVQNCPVYLCLPWLDGISDLLGKTQTIQRCYFSASVWVVFITKPILTSIQKDVVLPHHNNSLVYLLRHSCSSRYIGRTNQKLDATKIHNFIGGSTDNLRNTYRCSIAKHFINNQDCAVNFTMDLFSILNKLHSPFHLKVLETIYILSGRLPFCDQRECLLALNIISI